MYPISEKTKWPTVSSAIYGGISHLGVEFKPKLLQGVTKTKSGDPLCKHSSSVVHFFF